MDPIIIIGAGLLAFFLWSQSQGASGGLPADAAFTSEVAAGTAAAVPQSWASGASAAPGTATTAISYLYYGPSENTYYLVATAPTAAQTAAGAAFLSACPTGILVECAYSCPRAAILLPPRLRHPRRLRLHRCPDFGEWVRSGLRTGHETMKGKTT